MGSLRANGPGLSLEWREACQERLALQATASYWLTTEVLVDLAPGAEIGLWSAFA